MKEQKPQLQNTVIRTATSDDNAGLLELTSLSSMQGTIALCIDRQPDFFALLRARGESEVMIRAEGDKILGSFSISKQNIVIQNNLESSYYLADFKVHPNWRGSSVGVRLLDAMRERLQAASADLLFCTAAEGNGLVIPFFEGRLGFPKCAHLGKFWVFQIMPSSKVPNSEPRILEVPADFTVLDFYQQFYKNRYAIAPVIEPDYSSSLRHLVAFEGEKMIAAIALMDTSSLKQNIVKGMPWWLHMMVRGSKKLAPLAGWRPLPGIGEPIKVLNIRYWAYAPNQENVLKALIQKARNLAKAEGFHFVSIGVHEQDPLGPLLKKFPHVPFVSNGYVASLQNNQEKIQACLNGLVFEDFALV